MEFHERIKNVRKMLKLTQTEFADKLNISRSAVLNWEYGQNVASPAMIEKISRTFDINPMYLMGESDVIQLPPDEDEELIDRALESDDPLIKALLIGIVKKPDGWKMLAESILTCADYLRSHGFDLDNKKPEE